MLHIELNRYPVSMKLGYFGHERMVLQDVYISLKMQLVAEVDPKDSDDLRQTLDYGDVISFLNELLEGREIKLVETVVEKTGKGLLEFFTQLKSVEVCVEKESIPKAIGKGATVKVTKFFARAGR